MANVSVPLEELEALLDWAWKMPGYHQNEAVKRIEERIENAPSRPPLPRLVHSYQGDGGLIVEFEGETCSLCGVELVGLDADVHESGGCPELNHPGYP